MSRQIHRIERLTDRMNDNQTNMGQTNIGVLLVTDFAPELVEALDRQFILFDGRDPIRCQALLKSDGHRIRAVVTKRQTGASRDLILSLPKLEIISCFSAGLDGIDVATAADRGIVVTNTSLRLPTMWRTSRLLNAFSCFGVIYRQTASCAKVDGRMENFPWPDPRKASGWASSDWALSARPLHDAPRLWGWW